MLFLFENNISEEERLDKILEHVVDFLSIKNNDEILIIDPHFKTFFGNNIYFQQLFSKNEPYNNYIPFFEFLVGSRIRTLKIKIITEQPIFTSDSIIKSENNSLQFKKTLLGTDLDINVKLHPRKKNLIPNELHDRWIVKNSDEDKFGLHLGCSINALQHKDFTVSKIHNIQMFINRFNFIWNSNN